MPLSLFLILEEVTSNDTGWQQTAEIMEMEKKNTGLAPSSQEHKAARHPIIRIANTDKALRTK